MEYRTTVFNWGKILTEGQLRELEKAAETLELGGALVSSDNTSPDESVRVSSTAFFNPKDHPQVMELGDTISFEANRRFYGFYIDTGPEAQLAVYEGKNCHHYDWHSDVAWESPDMYDRKITTIILLSNPTEYEGGDIEFGGGLKYSAIERGTVITFPSYIRHKVHPVTSGIRVSLVIWASGPRFR